MGSAFDLGISQWKLCYSGGLIVGFGRTLRGCDCETSECAPFEVKPRGSRIVAAEDRYHLTSYSHVTTHSLFYSLCSIYGQESIFYQVLMGFARFLQS